MDLQVLVDLIEQSGFVGLYLWILLGASTLPVPNELIMMTIGLAASQRPETALPIFLTTYAGVLTAVSASYVLGRLVGRPLMTSLAKKKHFSKKLATSKRLMDKYHAFSLSVSYFVPGARSVIPFLYGFGKLSFRKFALYAYSGATAWFFLMFTAGYIFGDNIDAAAAYAGEIGVIVIVAIALILLAVKHRRKKRHSEEENNSLVSGPIPAMQKGSSD